MRQTAQYLLGLDIGSSSVKAALVELDSGTLIASAQSPESELAIHAEQPGFAEQDPEVWWEHVCRAVSKLRNDGGCDLKSVAAIGISYQMHGLVCVDAQQKVVRPAIIWCDSRAVTIGAEACASLGQEWCRTNLLNSPGNFTASKLAWVQRNEPEQFKRISKFMLPGDFIAMKLSGEINTTPSGLSEGILWNFTDERCANELLEHYRIPADLVADLVPTFAEQGLVSKAGAAALGISPSIPIAYRAGDQPNNALSLNVLNPGEVAATAGTSGVVYGVSDRAETDPQFRVNTFLHVNHLAERPRYGTLLCLNGCGALYRWLRQTCMAQTEYAELNDLAGAVAPGSDGLCMLPYGNGAERSLENRALGAVIAGIDLNRHGRGHLVRAAQEGIAFALNYGLEVMRSCGVRPEKVRAGAANLFKSPLFREIFSTVSGASIELYATDGAEGAARGAGVGAKLYRGFDEAFRGLRCLERVEPGRSTLREQYLQAYDLWRRRLQHEISISSGAE